MQVKIEILAGNLVLESAVLESHVVTYALDSAKHRLLTMFDSLEDKAVFKWTEVSVTILR